MASRAHAAPVKIVCLGLARTGTTSLRSALELLGFGPGYSMSGVLRGGGKDFSVWSQIGDGDGSPEIFDNLFRDYQVIADQFVAMYPAEIYAAYPGARFILTTRDPAAWEKSMHATVLRVPDILRKKQRKTGFEGPLAAWMEKYMLEKYHRDRLYTHTQQEILDHNERVIDTIPPEKLLVFDVSEGWDRLVEFLDLPKPRDPFPHVNDTATFERGLIRTLLE